MSAASALRGRQKRLHSAKRCGAKRRKRQSGLRGSSARRPTAQRRKRLTGLQPSSARRPSARRRRGWRPWPNGPRQNRTGR